MVQGFDGGTDMNARENRSAAATSKAAMPFDCSLPCKRIVQCRHSSRRPCRTGPRPFLFLEGPKVHHVTCSHESSVFGERCSIATWLHFVPALRLSGDRIGLEGRQPFGTHNAAMPGRIPSPGTHPASQLPRWVMSSAGKVVPLAASCTMALAMVNSVCEESPNPLAVLNSVNVITAKS